MKKRTCGRLFFGAAAKRLVNVMHFDELRSVVWKTNGLHSGFDTGKLVTLIRSLKWGTSFEEEIGIVGSSSATSSDGTAVWSVKLNGSIAVSSDDVGLRLGVLDVLNVDVKVDMDSAVFCIAELVDGMHQFVSVNDFNNGDRDTGDRRKIWNEERWSEKWFGKHWDAICNKSKFISWIWNGHSNS